MASLSERARAAVADDQLQEALGSLTGVLRRLTRAATDDPRVAERRERAAAVRRETLADLPGWLDRLERTLRAQGTTVHRAGTADDVRKIVLGIAQAEGVELVVKGKSMATEEVHLNPALEAAGIEVVETDLGEYIVQLAGETPSHIVGPALHKRLPEITALFSRVVGRDLPEDAEVLCAVARQVLREKFFSAGMGITGANFVAADTGTVVLVTNEGNGRMCSTLPRIHVVVMPVEKVIPRLADIADLVPVLTRWATGQALTTYVTMITGPRGHGDVDGPEQLHVVFLDGGRLRLTGTAYADMLACIRCGACLNVCPVYGKIGGHAYDAVYSGPMGAVLTPLLSGGREGRDLPGASSLCGACTDACPVHIPLADHLVRLRADLRPRRRRVVWGAWARLWARPRGYRGSSRWAGRLARLFARHRASAATPGADGWAASVPGAGGWAGARDVPLPAQEAFRDWWVRRGGAP
jgi:L-lactate dehydrogenase complex protein LldF